MILKRLFQSPWRKDNSATSKSATAQVATTATLEERLQDSNPEVRRQACKQTTNLDQLRRVADNDPDIEIRTFANAKFRDLLTGGATNSPPLDERITYCQTHLHEADAANLVMHILHMGKEPALRLAVLAQVTSPELIIECATKDTAAAVRLAAVERLEDKSQLDRVLHLVGKKDKGVFRAVKQRVKDIADREQAPLRLREEALTLCGRIEKLARRANWAQDRALADICIQQWAALTGTPDAELCTRFATAQDIFQQGYAAYDAERKARLAAEAAQVHLNTARQELLTELAAIGQETDPQIITTRISEIEHRWLALDSQAKAPEPLQTDYATQIQALQQQALHLQEVKDSKQRLSQHLKQAQRWLLKTKKPLDAPQIRTWKDECSRFASQCGDEELTGNYRDLLGQLQQRLQEQQDNALQQLHTLPERLDTLEQELESGVLRQANLLYQNLQAELKLIRDSGLARKNYESIEQRLHQLTPKLRELQSWRKWGTNQHRVDMCETLERLATEDLPLSLIAEQLQAMQDEWKNLDQDGIRISESLWQRFHRAADRLYDRCRPYLDEQNRLRNANREARESLCQQVETFLEQVNWEQLDWKKAVRAVREVRTTWENLGPVDPRHHKTLNQRYRNAMRQLNQPLAQERSRNRAFRQDLIAQAQAQATNPDISHAIQEIRHLQERWNITVAATRSKEEVLWQAFRAACDLVFERRREAQQVQQDALESHIQAMSNLCESLEILAKVPGSQNIPQQFEELKAKWEAGLEHGLPRQEEARLQRRWQHGVAAMRRRIKLSEEAAKRGQMERLRAQAAICAELESFVDKQAPTDSMDAAMAAEWQTRWANLPKNKDPACHAAMERRFNAAIGAAQTPTVREQFQASREGNTRERSLLCLQMEILAGVQSPAEVLQERLAFQVSRLAGRLTQGVADPLDEAPQLERIWYASGPALAERVEALEQRFERTRRVLSTRGAKESEARTNQAN